MQAKQIQNPDDEVEVEKDEEFNAVSDGKFIIESLGVKINVGYQPDNRVSNNLSRCARGLSLSCNQILQIVLPASLFCGLRN